MARRRGMSDASARWRLVADKNCMADWWLPAQRAKLSAECTVNISAEDTPELPSGLDKADIPLPEFDPPEFNAAQFLAPEPEQNCSETSRPSKCTRIKELVNEEYGGIPKRPWVEPCSGAGAVLEEGTIVFETHCKHQKEKQEPPWAPFDSRDE
ncbi:hypothetical protein OBBRIDRAFT_808853 [Obba rivulosa]|uniref:Uncharacterized protein n=1 Tax=Obba rivulosa TaxID=1052685 RepID=A0A8E2AFQ6_9APHY|nr:hypothetical protein OBBRIDRAFT_808853 [Obba rivulosa]